VHEVFKPETKAEALTYEAEVSKAKTATRMKHCKFRPRRDQGKVLGCLEMAWRWRPHPWWSYYKHQLFGSRRLC